MPTRSPSMSPIEKLHDSTDSRRPLLRVRRIRQLAAFLFATAAAAGAVGYAAASSGEAEGEAGPAFVDKIPPGYRDWKLISVAHEEGNLHSFAAVLGNDIAIKAYRERTMP